MCPNSNELQTLFSFLLLLLYQISSSRNTHPVCSSHFKCSYLQCTITKCLPRVPPPLAPTDGLSIWRRGEGKAMQRGSCLTSCGLNTGGKWSVLAQPGKGTESLIDRGALRAPYTCKALELRPKSGCCISSSECKWTACRCQGLKLIRHLACVMHILSQSNCFECHTMISGFLFLQVAIISSSL